jgi:hypothetical protein
LTALTKRLKAGPVWQELSLVVDRLEERWLKNVTLSITGLSNCKQKMAKFWSADLPCYTVRPGT